jgi:hypothetical protein
LQAALIVSVNYCFRAELADVLHKVVDE